MNCISAPGKLLLICAISTLVMRKFEKLLPRLGGMLDVEMVPEVVTLTDLLGEPDFVPAQRLERDVETLLLRHLAKRGEVTYPVSTNDLTTLLEKHVDELDLYADLSGYGDVEGATIFQKNAKPKVRIDASLSETPNENRLRSTLAHEFGHVILHDPMFQRRAQQQSFESEQREVLQVSFRDGFAAAGDLFEFQAWCVCGALLMPITELSRIVGGMAAAANHYAEIYLHSDLGCRIHEFTAKRFGVSRDLARVRLLRAKVVTDKPPSPSLF